MILYAKNTLTGLMPMYPSDLDEKKKLHVGTVYKVKVSQPRNLGHHKKFFALIKLVFDNQEQFADIEHLRKELTIAAGYYDEYFDINGIHRKDAKSLSFGSMDQADFTVLYDRIIDAINEHFGWEKESLRNQVEQYF